jgi:hypothetical protein
MWAAYGQEEPARGFEKIGSVEEGDVGRPWRLGKFEGGKRSLHDERFRSAGFS